MTHSGSLPYAGFIRTQDPTPWRKAPGDHSAVLPMDPFCQPLMLRDQDVNAAFDRHVINRIRRYGHAAILCSDPFFNGNPSFGALQTKKGLL
ncbi:MAG: hypothetical protein IJ174_09900 [Clostridia bacterium]|nr:hypothetical protein [Clostridia bacterium]